MFGCSTGSGAAGVTAGYVRLCVGIEDVEDIRADLDQALQASQA